jgi:molecular chaperone GrpE
MAGDDREHDHDSPKVRVVDRRWWARGEDADAEPDDRGRKPTVVEDLERQVADAQQRLQDFIVEHKRSIDEFEQAKVRNRRDVARDVERGKRAILVDLLEVVDNLDRAIAAARDGNAGQASAAADTLIRGVELVRDLFLAKLEALGVVRVPALGEPFDAMRHEAVTMAAVSDPQQDGLVVAVVKEGYAIGDDLLRPASVVVGTASGGG